jgi:hypothetical protein
MLFAGCRILSREMRDSSAHAKDIQLYGKYENTINCQQSSISQLNAHDEMLS